MNIFVLFLFAIYADAQNYEGDLCTKDGVSGVCTYLNSCPSAISDLQNKKKPQTCGFGGRDPIVCCIRSEPAVTQKPVLTTTKRSSPTSTTEFKTVDYDYPDVEGTGSSKDGCPPIPSALTSKKTGQKAWDKCVEYQEKLVFPCAKCTTLDGRFCRENRCKNNAEELIVSPDAAPYEFSHVALLGYGNNTADLQWMCGGSLISDKFILTAGHCIASRDRGEVTYVQLGIHRRSQAAPNNLYRVKKIHRHPQFNPPKKYHDIALLELESLVPLNEFLVPACIDTSSNGTSTFALSTGWGLITHNDRLSSFDQLQKVTLTKFNDSECASIYQPTRLLFNGVDKSSQVCYGDRTKSKDTCLGESGGPLQIKNKQIACMYTIIGVTSFGSACRSVGLADVYTRVQHYVSWIEGIVWP